MVSYDKNLFKMWRLSKVYSYWVFRMPLKLFYFGFAGAMR